MIWFSAAAVALLAQTETTQRSLNFVQTVDPAKMVILCDPLRFRISIRHSADHASLDRSYTYRKVIHPESLIAYSARRVGEVRYQRSLSRYEQCGPFAIRLRGDFLNTNVDGEMGAIPPFAAVTITYDNQLLYPQNQRREMRLSPCDLQIPRWENCPAEWAVRVDMIYVPDEERVSVREWVSSGDVLADRFDVIERQGSVPAHLRLW